MFWFFFLRHSSIIHYFSCKISYSGVNDFNWSLTCFHITHGKQKQFKQHFSKILLLIFIIIQNEVRILLFEVYLSYCSALQFDLKNARTEFSVKAMLSILLLNIKNFLFKGFKIFYLFYCSVGNILQLITLLFCLDI